MPFIIVKQGRHPSDRMFARLESQAAVWVPMEGQATQFASREDAETMTRRDPPGLFYEGGCTFEIVEAVVQSSRPGPFVVAAYGVSAGRFFYFATDGVDVCWSDDRKAALRFAVRGDADLIAGRLSRADDGARKALQLAGLLEYAPLSFAVEAAS